MALNLVLEKDSWESLGLQGDQTSIFTGRTDAEIEAPILWPPNVKHWLIGKDPDAGKDWRQEEKGMIVHEMAEWHHWLGRHEFEQTLEGVKGQGCPACSSPWGCKESDLTERLNNNWEKKKVLWDLFVHFGAGVVCLVAFLRAGCWIFRILQCRC